MINKKNKTIDFILSSFSGGGAEKMMVFLANGFANKGYKVNLIVLRGRGPYKDLVDKKVNLIIGPNLPNVFLYIPWLVFKLLRKNSDTIISTQTHVNITTTLAALIANKNNKVILRESRTIPVNLGTKNITQKISKYYLPKLIYPLNKKFIAISDQVKKDMLSFYKLKTEEVKVIYSPVIPKNISQLAEEAVVHPWFSKQYKVIVSIGSVNPVKNFYFLLQAFKIVKESAKNCRLVIIGKYDQNDSYYKKLNKYILEHELKNLVTFIGFVNNPYKYLTHSDLFVLTSEKEAFGNVIVEALACGCPVVSTDCHGGPREILDNGKYGNLVTPGNENIFAQAMITTLSSPPNKEFLKKRGLNFSLINSVSNYEKFIHS